MTRLGRENAPLRVTVRMRGPRAIPDVDPVDPKRAQWALVGTSRMRRPASGRM